MFARIAKRFAAVRYGQALLGLFSLGLLAGTWGFWVEPASLHNATYRLDLPRWPAACLGLRVAVLADLHTGSPFNGLDKLDEIVALTQKAKPDLVLLAGDYVIDSVKGGRFVPPREIAARLARLRAPLGVHAVLGNHDWWNGAAKVRTALEGAGIPVLDDKAVPLAKGACRFWLAGLADLWEGKPDVRRALQDVPPGAAVLAFTHNPDLFPAIPANVALTVAGHTHGGQVRVPLYGPVITPSRHGKRYAQGHIVERDRHLFVSPGLGTSIIPVRFLVPPEVSVLRLYPRETAPVARASR
jgi:predicted MPP superfamily phosphohydrolase